MKLPNRQNYMNLKCFAAVTAVPLLGMTLHAAEIEITPGSLAASMRGIPAEDSVLVIKGEADARDFPALMSLPGHISRLDMSGLRIVECTMPSFRPGERSYYADGELKDYIFFGSALKYVALPSNVEVIPEGAFASSMIEEVALPEGLHTVSAYAFYGCTKLAAFHGPAALLSVGDCAFAKCTSLKDVTLPKGVAIDGAEVFSGSALASIDASGAVSYGDYSLSGIKSMRKAIVNPGATFGDGVLMSNSLLAQVEGTPQEVPTLYAASSKVLKISEIMEKATEVGDYAFSSSYLSHIVFSSSLNHIGEGAFARCTGLQSIDANLLGASLPTVADDAFEGISTKDVFLYVSPDSYDIWASDPLWSRFEIIAGPSKIEGVEADSKIIIYPHKDVIVVEWPTTGGEVWIYGVNGNVVHSGSYSGDRVEIDMSGIGDKILIVKASTEGSLRTATVMMP